MTDISTSVECELVVVPPGMAGPGDGDGGSGGDYDPTDPAECTKPHPEVNGVTVSCDHDEEDPDEPEDICEQIQKLLVDAEFKLKMGELNTAANSFNYKIGYTMHRKADGTFRYTYFKGNPNSGGLDNLTVNSHIDGLIHSHYSGPSMLSIFSIEDIFSLANLLRANLINPNNFVFGVVTFGGTYLLNISDANKLLNYTSGVDINNDNQMFIYRFLYRDFVSAENSSAQNEIGLVQFLRLNDLGLNLTKGNINGFNEWNKLGVNRTGTNTINLICN